jgi:flagellar biosynthesis protein FliQ
VIFWLTGFALVSRFYFEELINPNKSRFVLLFERIPVTPESVMTMGRNAMEVTLMVAAPMLLVALIIGLIVSIFQAATQINEATLSFIPKLIGIFVALIVAGPWMLAVMLDYMRQVFNGIPGLIG